MHQKLSSIASFILTRRDHFKFTGYEASSFMSGHRYDPGSWITTIGGIHIGNTGYTQALAKLKLPQTYWHIISNMVIWFYKSFYKSLGIIRWGIRSNYLQILLYGIRVKYQFELVPRRRWFQKIYSDNETSRIAPDTCQAVLVDLFAHCGHFE